MRGSCNLTSGPSLALDVHALVSPTFFYEHLQCSTWPSCCHACAPPIASDSSGSVCSSSRSTLQLGGEFSHIMR
eukprot:7628860-Alexandrium_andersonii.AAC.1